MAVADGPFSGRVVVDEGSFGPSRMRGLSGRGAGRKPPGFGILERGGRGPCRIATDC